MIFPRRAFSKAILATGEGMTQNHGKHFVARMKENIVRVCSLLRSPHWKKSTCSLVNSLSQVVNSRLPLLSDSRMTDRKRGECCLHGRLLSQRQGQNLPWAGQGCRALHLLNWQPQLFLSKDSPQGVVFGTKTQIQALLHWSLPQHHSSATTDTMVYREWHHK